MCAYRHWLILALDLDRLHLLIDETQDVRYERRKNGFEILAVEMVSTRGKDLFQSGFPGIHAL